MTWSIDNEVRCVREAIQDVPDRLGVNTTKATATAIGNEARSSRSSDRVDLGGGAT